MEDSGIRCVHPSFPRQLVCDGAATQVLPPALGPSDEGATMEELQKEGFHGTRAALRLRSTLRRKCRMCRMQADSCYSWPCPLRGRCWSPDEREAVRRGSPVASEPGLEARAALQHVLLLLRRLCANDQLADCDPQEGQMVS